MNELQFAAVMRRFDELEKKLTATQEVMDTHTAAVYAGTTPSRILSLIDDGRLNGSRPDVNGTGGPIYIKKKDLDALLMSTSPEKARLAAHNLIIR